MRILKHRAAVLIGVVLATLMFAGERSLAFQNESDPATDRRNQNQSADQPTQATPGAVDRDSRRSDSDQSRRFGRGMSMGRRFLDGTYDLKVVIKPPTDTDPLQVLVNGEAVDANTAAFLLRFIRHQKMRKALGNGGRNTDGGAGGEIAEPDGRAGLRRGPRGPSDGGGKDWSRFNPGPLTPEMIDDVLSVLRDFEPREYGRLLQLQRSDNQERFQMEIRRFRSEYWNVIDLKKNDEEAYGLALRNHEIDEESRALRFEIGMQQPTEESVIADYRRNLRELLIAQFDIQQQLRKRELTKMGLRLEELQNRLDERGEQRDELIDRRLDSILDELLTTDR